MGEPEWWSPLSGASLPTSPTSTAPAQSHYSTSFTTSPSVSPSEALGEFLTLMRRLTEAVELLASRSAELTKALEDYRLYSGKR